jgi:hypothetical protein
MITVKGKKTASKAGKTEKSSTVSVAAANEKNPDNGDHNRGILSSLWPFVSALVTFTFLLLVFGLHDLSEVLDGLLTVGGAVTAKLLF